MLLQKMMGLACMGGVVVTLAATPASALLVFNSAQSSVLYQHDIENDRLDDIDTGARTFEAQATQTGTAIPKSSTPTRFFNQLDQPGEVNGRSTARAGIGHNETATRASVSIAALTGISQRDPGDLMLGESELIITAHLVWDVVGTPFGPPISAVFSLPVSVQIPAGSGGHARVDVDVHWNAVQGGVAKDDVRLPFTDSFLFFANTTTTINAPAAAVTGITGGKLVAGDKYIIDLRIVLFADNAEDEVSIELGEGDAAFGESTPEPASMALGGLGLAALAAATRRRR